MGEEFRLNLKGMSCGSCEKLVGRVIAQNNGELKEVNVKEGYVILQCEQEQLSQIKNQLSQKGFPKRTTDEQGNSKTTKRGEFKNVLGYLEDLIGGHERLEVEIRLLNYTMGSLIALILLGLLAYMYLLKNFDYAGKYAPIAFLALLTAVATAFSYYHILCYRKEMSCTNGMMIGMTTGMMLGFMGGALIGITNGMFIGSMTGILFGIAVGFSLGRCCGSIGAMEGMMAGFMSGVMGAMTSVMMLNDNLVLFLYIAFSICLITIGGLSYMMHREVGPCDRNELKAGFKEFLLMSLVLSILFVGLMFYGPKGPIIY